VTLAGEPAAGVVGAAEDAVTGAVSAGAALVWAQATPAVRKEEARIRGHAAEGMTDEADFMGAPISGNQEP
jgi:hypothetical protein